MAQDRPPTRGLGARPVELQGAVAHIGAQLPQLWSTQILAPPQRKALRRGRIDKVVLHRVARSQAQVRIVWRGGETTTMVVPVQGKSLAALPQAAEMEQLISTLYAAGHREAEMARRLTAQGHRSPSRPVVFPNTVRLIRLKQRRFQKRSQSHPRHLAGALTVPQIARVLAVPVHWIYAHMHRGTSAISKDPTTRLDLFPDRPQTLRLFQELQPGKRRKIRFPQGSLRGAASSEAAVIHESLALASCIGVSR